MSRNPIEPDLYAMDVDAAKITRLDGTGLEYAPIGDSDHYAVRDKDRLVAEIRRPGDDFRKLGAILGRGPGDEPAAEGLDDIAVDEDRFERIDGTALEYAPIDGLDAYAVRDTEHRDKGQIRRPGNDWRKLGAVL